MSIDDVTVVLRKFPPRLTSPRDTVTFEGRRLILHYSLDTALQHLGKQLMNRYHPKYGAIVAIEPSNGRICGLLSYTNPEVTPLGSNLYCQSQFPAASIFKTVTAAAAIEKSRYTSESIFKIAGSRHTLYKSQLVEDLAYGQEITLADAYAYSVNPVFGRIGIFSLGASGLRTYAQKFGFNTPVPFELDNEAPATMIEDSTYRLAELASGFNQKTLISPLFGALLASAIINRGFMPVPTLVDSVTDGSSGTVLYRAAPQHWRTPISASTANEMEKLMRSVVQYGTARKSFRFLRQNYHLDDVSYGGKTGSIDKDTLGRVDWFIGFARHSTESGRRIATAVVTVHGAYWTVHSSFVAAELMRTKIRSIQAPHIRMPIEQIEEHLDTSILTTTNDSVEE
jgi:peptidoglycan glycosyltransferase